LLIRQQIAAMGERRKWRSELKRIISKNVAAF